MKLTTILFCLFQIWAYPLETSEMIKIDFLGRYQMGRAPCEWLPDGTRRWAITTGFNVVKVMDGDVQVSYIEIAADYKYGGLQLQEGAVYHVSMTLSPERFATLKLGDEHTQMTHQDPIIKKEITQIEKK